MALTFSWSGIAHADVVKFDISQADAFLPEIKIYASLVGGVDESMISLAKGDLIAKIDGKPLVISNIKPFRDSGEGVAYTILLDVSMTMSGIPFNNAVKAVNELISSISDKDKISIITFGDNVSTVIDFSNNKEVLLTKIKEIAPTHNNTHFYAAINEAMALNMRRDQSIPVRRAILVITDGKDEGSGITIDDLARLHEGFSIPIYSIGFTSIEVEYLDNLKRLSELSGGRFVRGESATDFQRIFQKTFNDIYSQYVISAIFSEGRADGDLHRILVTYSKGGNTISAEKRIAFLYDRPPVVVTEAVIQDVPKTNPSPEKPVNTKQRYYLLGAGALLLFFLIRKRARKHIESLDDEIELIQPEEHEFIPPVISPHVEDQEEVRFYSARLIIIEGPNKGKVFPVFFEPKRGECGCARSPKRYIGRDIQRTQCSPTLQDDRVSKIHCSISGEDHERFILRDEGSRNGTILNGIPVKTQEIIEDGDTIEVGQTKIRFKTGMV